MDNLTTLQHIKNCMNTVRGFVGQVLEAVIDALSEMEDKVNPAYNHSESPHAPTDAEKNIIVGVKKNGEDINIDDKRVIDIQIPTKVSELKNDLGYKTTDFGFVEFNVDNDGNLIVLNSNGSVDFNINKDGNLVWEVIV